ncbi:MAG: TIGR02449 family protein [Pseudomonadota bacterium]
MEQQAIAQLEQSLGQLVEKYTKLKQENVMLHKRNAKLEHDCKTLQQKNSLASSKLEAMIERLKEMEIGHE